MSYSPLTILLCVCLMVVYMAQGLMITASKNAQGGYDYDKNVSVMLSEICKFMISSILLLYQFTKRWQQQKCTDHHQQQRQHTTPLPPLTSKLGLASLKFAVPAVLYAIHNNIIFIALEMLSPVTYQLFNNIKIVTTGLVFRLFLSRPLRLHQWMAILLLPLSMCVTQLGNTSSDNNNNNNTNDDDITTTEAEIAEEKVVRGFLWMLVLSLCSAFAGVYNEYLIKQKGDHPQQQSSLMWKNMQLYFFGTVFCIISYHSSSTSAETVGGGGDVATAAEYDGGGTTQQQGGGMLHGFTPMAWGVVLLNGILGQIISAIFFYADNIVKVYAASGAVLLTPLISHSLFQTPLHAPLGVGIGVALISLFMYFLPPTVLSATDVDLAASFECYHNQLPTIAGSGGGGGGDDSTSNSEQQQQQEINIANSRGDSDLTTNLIQRNTPKSLV